MYRKGIKISAVCLHIISAALLVLLVMAVLTGEITISKLQEDRKNGAGSREAYLQSEAYAGRVFRQMQTAIRLSWQETIFETNGKLDLEKEIARIQEDDGTVTVCRLGDIVQAEVGGGFEIRPEYRDYPEDFWYWQEEAERNADIWMGSGSRTQTATVITDALDTGEVPEEWAGENPVTDYGVTGTTDYGITDAYGQEPVKVLWFACDRRHSPIYEESEEAGGAKTITWSKRQMGWTVLDCLEQYLDAKKSLQKDGHNFYYAFTGSIEASNGKTPEEILALGSWYQIEKLPGRYEEGGNVKLFGEQGYNPYYYEKLDTTDYYRLEQEGDRLYIGVDTAFPQEDVFVWQLAKQQKEHREAIWFLVLLPAALLCFCLTFVYLIRAAGRTSRPGDGSTGFGKRGVPDSSIRLNFFDKIPFEGLLLVGMLLVLSQRSLFSSSFWPEFGRIGDWEVSDYVIEAVEAGASPAWSNLVGSFLGNLTVSEISNLICFGTLLVDYLFLLAIGLRLLRRKRQGSSCSLILRGGRWLYQVSRENIKLSWQTGLVTVGGSLLLAVLAFLTGIQAADRKNTVFVTGAEVFLIMGVLAIFLIKKAQEKDALLREVARLAEGNLEAEIPWNSEKEETEASWSSERKEAENSWNSEKEGTEASRSSEKKKTRRKRGGGKEPVRKYGGAEKKLAGHLGHIREGMKKAVEQAMKNERMKTELITNVSHDIKTPLTSIINYADLLKRELFEESEKTVSSILLSSGGDAEEGQKPDLPGWTGVSDGENGEALPEEGQQAAGKRCLTEGKQQRIRQYLEVLDQKSKRLKTLTEDLVEASKASSGTLTITPEKINLAELAAQVNGEFEEKFADRQLTLVSRLSGEPVYILAEGRRVYRILENLYQNAFKYAMAGTRVYVETALVEKPADGTGQTGPDSGSPQPAGRQAVFTIKNISAEPLSVSAEELAERFVRGDMARSSEGSGLGLSIAKSLTELQQGSFTLSLDGDLFRVQVTFPEYV